MQNEIVKIEKILNTYGKGCLCADKLVLASVFTASASMYGFIMGNLRQMSATTYIEAIASETSMESRNIPFSWEIGDIKICGNIASAAFFEHKFENQLEFCDIFQLMKIDDSWKIVNKLFTTID